MAAQAPSASDDKAAQQQSQNLVTFCGVTEGNIQLVKDINAVLLPVNYSVRARSGRVPTSVNDCFPLRSYTHKFMDPGHCTGVCTQSLELGAGSGRCGRPGCCTLPRCQHSSCAHMHARHDRPHACRRTCTGTW